MDRYDSSSDKVINFRGFLAQKGIDYRFYEEEDQSYIRRGYYRYCVSSEHDAITISSTRETDKGFLMDIGQLVREFQKGRKPCFASIESSRTDGPSNFDVFSLTWADNDEEYVKRQLTKVMPGNTVKVCNFQTYLAGLDERELREIYVQANNRVRSMLEREKQGIVIDQDSLIEEKTFLGFVMLHTQKYGVVFDTTQNGKHKANSESLEAWVQEAGSSQGYNGKWYEDFIRTESLKDDKQLSLRFVRGTPSFKFPGEK